MDFNQWKKEKVSPRDSFKTRLAWNDRGASSRLLRLGEIIEWLLNTVYVYIYIYSYVYIYLNRSLLSRMSLCVDIYVTEQKNYTGALKLSYILLCSTAHGNKIYSLHLLLLRIYIYIDPIHRSIYMYICIYICIYIHNMYMYIYIA